MRLFYLLPIVLLLLLSSSVSATNLFRRDGGPSDNCVQCPNPPDPCSECPTDQVCVLVTRTCTACSFNQCQSLDALTSPQSQTPDTPVANNSSASYIILSVCGAGVAMLLATGMFVVYRRRRAAAAAAANGNDLDSGTQSRSSMDNPLKYAIGKPTAALTTAQQQRGVSAVSSVEWDVGSSLQDDTSVAFHQELMHKPYGNVNRANDALARYTLHGPTPLLPEPVMQTSDRFLSEFLSEVEAGHGQPHEAEADDDDDNQPLAMSTRQSITHHRSLSASNLNSYKFPSTAAKRSSPTSLPDIPEASYRDSYTSQGSSASEASLHSVAKVNIARVEPAIARSTMVVPQRAVVMGGSFTSMRSSNEFDSLGDSRNKLSAVGSGSFSRVASTISAAAAAAAAGGHRQTMSLNSKWQAPLGRADAYQKLIGKTADNNLVMNREKTEREKRRDSMVREAMRRASVEHVKLGTR